ncbi:DUF1289 domain-containing protein [Oryzifoliimicrobium ureilyticus]|uniref:DUF1289 domain-containing protein n=1 Tax=Oryzifoliimicrobium ureilyticus TaxID=3113724 RepID=UPI003076816E
MLTPCIQICSIQPETGLCIGCKRSLSEIAAWSSYSDLERQHIMDLLELRARPEETAVNEASSMELAL